MVFLNEYAGDLLRGLLVTLLLALGSWLLAFAVGLLLTVMRLARVRIVGPCVLAFVEYQRNVPPLVHLFLWYFGVSSLLPVGLQEWLNEHHGELIFAVIAIGLYYGAYFAEDIRSGLRSIAPGQQEAALALGLGQVGTLRRVVLPQALRVAIAPLLSNTVMLMKTTSLAMVIGVMELTYVTKEVASGTFRIFASYGLSTVLYVAVALSLLLAGGWLGRRVRIRGR
ncbi:MAG: amino acid ABC transporter permease [Pseudomonas sp.]|uniref:amino acid ABC transporter permease n=1 Tax=unclassified Pseudomonas TaxID=196821 RepID=UPI0007305ECD|nr:amino acid ABC transporter permease [Pseudomonas sp. L5B5]KTC36243.1 amino acid ABC transporter permease [Pseudomonas sp. ABAC61]UCZ86211.1 amino acid ABC transporter permease [Pseudomonas sp. L5B5]